MPDILFNAIFVDNDEEKAIKIFKTGGFDLSYEPSKLKMTSLLVACAKKMETLVELILDEGESHGYPERVEEQTHETALTWCCHNKMERLAIKILKTGRANPEQITAAGSTAFCIAAMNRMREFLELIIEVCPARAGFIENSYETPLLYIVSYIELEDIVLRLLSMPECIETINTRCEMGYSCLAIAVHFDLYRAVDRMLDIPEIEVTEEIIKRMKLRRFSSTTIEKGIKRLAHLSEACTSLV